MLIKIHLVKALVFPVDMYGCDSWTIKKAKHQRTDAFILFYLFLFFRLDAFKLCHLRRLFRVPLTARRSNQSILREISPEYSLEWLMLKLRLQFFSPDVKDWLIGKGPDAQKDWKQEAKGTTEYEVGWHHHFVGHEFEQAPGVGEILWSLACYGPLCRSESDMTEWLYWTEYILECTKLRHWYLLTDVINCYYHLPYSCH